MKPGILNGKELLLGILTVAVGFLNAYLWKGVLISGEFPAVSPVEPKDAAFYSLPVVALFLFAILFALSSAFIKKPVLRTVSAMIALAGGYLLVPATVLAASSAAASALAGWYASDAIAAEYRDSNAFHVRKIFRGGLPVFFSAVALTLAVFYFAAVSGAPGHAILPKALFDAAIPLVEQPLQNFLPGFRRDATVDELLLAFAVRQAGVGADIKNLSAAEKQALVGEGRVALSRELGVELTGRERGGDLIYRTANAQIEKLAGPYRAYLPFIAAAGFFIAIKALTVPVYWVSLILLFAVVKLLLKIGVLEEKIENIQVVRVTL